MNAALAPPMRVFLVDDDRDTTECMSLLFKLWGHEVHVANEGKLAIEQAAFVKPDLMLIDLAMPIVDGLQVARAVRQYDALASMSLIAVSGYADTRHQQEALDAGFDECLVKPLPADDILALLARVRERIAATKQRAALSTEMVAISQEKQARSLAPLSTSSAVLPEAIPALITKSGISDVVSLSDRGAAERLRHWLRQRGCRVGPVFEPKPGEFAFFNYSRRQMRLALRDNAEFRIEE